MGQSDLISRLPTDLLISVLSRLTLKEATATSVLSRHWEKLWTFYPGSLDFKVEFHKVGCCSNYLRVVNKVLNTFEQVEDGGVFDSFTIRCHLCPNITSSVDRCVQFAMKNRVKSLQFDAYYVYEGCDHRTVYGALPTLKRSYSQPCSFQTLTYISFQNVNVSSEIIENFISNCPVLQSLILTKSSLTHLRVSGETIALRHLDIGDCPYLTTIDLCAPNLVSLKYTGNYIVRAKFYVRNIPKLEKLSTGPLEIPMNALSLDLIRCFPHIQKLYLGIGGEVQEPRDLSKLIQLTSVKHLTLGFTISYRESILEWIPLLKGFPALQKLTLDIRSRLDNGTNKVIRVDNKFPGKCLKVLEVMGYGMSKDNELLLHLLENIASLEKIIVSCNNGVRCRSGRCVAANLAAKLKQVIPKEVNLVFCSLQRVISFDDT